MTSSGKCEPRFERVREAFEKNFSELGEVGASLCITVEGEPVVDLWGGLKDPQTAEPWAQDTVSLVWSSTKGAAGLCANMLVSRGLLDLEAPVVKYWPEFGQAGKERTTVRMLLDHSSGVAAIRAQLPAGAFYDWPLMVRLLEQEAPWWEPGTRHGYHGFTFGWLVGELIRRVSGKSMGTFFRDEVATPLGLDFFVGAPESVEPRLAKMILAPVMGSDPAKAMKLIQAPYFPALFWVTKTLAPHKLANVAPFMLTALQDKHSLQGRMLFNTGGHNSNPSAFDSRQAHAAEIPSAGGITNARGLAGMYAPLACGGTLKGVEFVNAATLEAMRATSRHGTDAVLGTTTHFTPGFFRSWDNRERPPNQRETLILGEQAFGYPGAGGSLGFADVKERVSFGYSLNRMAQRMGADQRQQRLVDALYVCLGYASNASGNWTR